MKRFVCGSVCLAAVLGVASQARSGYLLWSDNHNFGPGGDIRRADLDGSNEMTLISGLNSPDGIAVDPLHGKMYWGDYVFGSDPNVAPPTGDVSRANLDGTGQEMVVPQQIFPVSVALDVAAGQMYWIAHAQQSSPFGKDIRRANLDGSNQLTIIHTAGVIGNGALALDVSGGKIYTTDYNENRIRSFNLDGSGEKTLISGLNGPVGIALDLPDGKMFWGDYGGNTIYDANLDGTGKKAVLRNLAGPDGLALDLAAGKIYWTDYGTPGVANGDIRVANLDGSNPQTLVRGLNGPITLDLVPEPSGVVLLAVCIAGFLRPRRPTAGYANGPLCRTGALSGAPVVRC